MTEWSAAYREATERVWRHWTPAMQGEIARHCAGWGAGRFDFRVYLDASSERFRRAYLGVVARPGVRTVCDVGGFWGVFPLTLALLGYRATMTEALGYYSSGFDGLFAALGDAGVEVMDFDPFTSPDPLPRRFDAVTALAVLEHYPHSPSVFLRTVAGGVREGGSIFLEVPNVAFWPKRLALLRGRSPLPPLADVFASAIPFTGHHREYTAAELREVAELAGLEVVSAEQFNYSPPPGGVRGRVRRPLDSLIYALFPNTRECLAVVCR
ncbi:MAG TPA: methyltransferase domain-containing protein [Longimicrobium sp.]|nr:methyltransferase domain-containing protein [Longimicrobium sp.]